MKIKNILPVVIIATALTYAEDQSSYSVSNLTAWVGVDINVLTASNLPQRATSSPGDVFLGFVRTFVTGNIQDYAFHMSPQNRIDHFGTASLDDIPLSYISSRSSMLFDTNLCITAFSSNLIGSNSVDLSVSIAETTEDDTEEVTFLYRMTFTNGVWAVDGSFCEDNL